MRPPASGDPSRADSPSPGGDHAGDPAGDPAAWVDEHGDALYRYAVSQTGDRTTAEDLVQETFLAALTARERFRGGSSTRTWLIGVLRHKLVDHWRRRGRSEEAAPPEGLDTDVTGAFDKRGRWIERPGRWMPALPDGELERREFWATLQHCVEGVPGRPGEAFALRVLCELPAEEVCKVLDVKPTNLWVLLHRARTRLRLCLETTWVG